MFVDESFAHEYVVIGHIVEIRNTNAQRRQTRGLALKGQRSIHFQKESERRRKQLLVNFTEMDSRCIGVRLSGSVTKDSRYIALRFMLREARAIGVTRVVFDLDISTQVTDRLVVKEANMAGAEMKELSCHFASRHEEPLLWVSDAVAWCVARGGDWARRCVPLLHYGFATI